MTSRMSVLIAGSLLLPAAAAAQGTPGVLRSSEPTFAEWSLPAPTRPALRPVLPGEGADHTVLGLAIGAAIGIAAGYAFYDVMCEAVDNNCSDSRLGLLVLGAGVGGALGALVGSVVD